MSSEGVYRGSGSPVAAQAVSYLTSDAPATITGNWTFTGSVTVDGNAPLSPTISTLAKGDFLATDGIGWYNLAVGTNGTVLTADSTQTYGVKWGIPSGGVSRYVSDVITTVTLAQYALDSRSFTHGFGTHATVKVEVIAQGSNTDEFVISWKDDNGLGGMVQGQANTSFYFQGVSTASAGQVAVTTKQLSATPQTISYKIIITEV